uniref:Uncharacterized protein n=1 Tax=Monopterus albus TaxID=43700 RepID=A0A3Q3IBB5_MONAL
MASMEMQLLASGLCLLGWIGIIISCLLPMWKVTAFVGSTIVTAQTVWEGIWMACVAQSTNEIQCKPYESLLILGAEVQAARALMVLAITTGIAGLLLVFVGGKCTRFLDEQGGIKSKLALAAGAVFIATGLLCLIPTSWTAGAVVKNFYSTTIESQRREIGACLYIGWGASIMLILGGGLLICTDWPLNTTEVDKSPSVRYLVVRSSIGSSYVASHRSRAPSTKSQPVRAPFNRSQSYEGSPMKSSLYTRPSWEDEPEHGSRQETDRSWTPSTKSQMKRPESANSQHSVTLSTKSQFRSGFVVKIVKYDFMDRHY